MNLIDNITKDLLAATYKWGDSKYDSSVITSERAVPTIKSVLASNLEEEARKYAELEAKCYAYEAIISNSNFAPVFGVKEEPKQNKLTEEMIMAIWGTLIEEGNHDIEHFRLGETIRYTPDEVADILRMKFKGDTE